MAQIKCSVCEADMVIDEADGEAHTTEKGGAIHHPFDCKPQPIVGA